MRNIIIILILVLLNPLLRGLSIDLNYHNKDYTLISNSYPDDKNIYADIDSIYVFKTSMSNDSLYIFVSKRSYIFFTIKNNEGYFIQQYYPLEYTHLFDIFCLDLDNDNSGEIVSILGDEDSYDVYVHKVMVRKEEDILIEILRLNLSYYRLEDNITFYSYFNSTMFFLYSQITNDGKKTLGKVGSLQYTNDETKELYFMPVKIIDRDEWITNYLIMDKKN